MTLQVHDAAVESLYHPGSARGPLVLARSLVGSPTALRQAGACVGGGAGQFLMPGDLGGMVLLPGGPFSLPPFDPALVTARVGARKAIAGRVEVQEAGRHVAQQGAVVAD